MLRFLPEFGWLPRLAVLAVLALGGRPAAAQTPAPGWYRMGNWQQSNGLPQNWVMSLIQTSDGYIWVGTRGGGLARFDGVNFTTYDESKVNQLRESEVWALAEGPDGSLWIATYSAGVTRLKDGKFTSYSTADGLVDNFITSMSRDRAGGIWMAGDQGVSCFRDGRFINYTPKNGRGPGARAVYADSEGNVWLGTDRGKIFRLQDESFEPMPPVSGPLPTNEIRGLYRDRDGGFWITGTDGVFRIQDGRSRHYTTEHGLSANGTFHTLHDRKGNIWVTTALGLDLYDRDKDAFHLEHQLGSGQPIHTICEDREGSIWIGSRSDGVTRLHQGVFVSYSRLDGMVDDAVSSVVEDKTGRMWCGTYKGLHSFADGKFTAYDTPSGVPARLIVSLGKDRAGHLWVGTSAGLYRSVDSVDRPGTRPPRFVALDEELTPRLHVRTLHEDREGAMWIATNLEGLVRYRGGEFTFFTTTEGLAHNAVRGIAEDRDGALWLGTRNGLSRLRDGKFTTFREADGLPNNTVQAVYLDRANNVWIGTRRGIARYRAGQFTAITAVDGLFSNYVFGFMEDDQDRLWMTCGKGIFYVERPELEAFAARRSTSVRSMAFGREHGLRSTGGPAGHSPVMGKASDGQLWFAFLGGLSVVDPARLVPNKQPPPVHLEAMSIDRQAYAPRDFAEIAPGRGDLEFHFTALSFMAPEKLRLRYKLEGYDPDWIEAGNRRSANYSNIPPGDYTFKVIAANSEGVWNTVGASAHFRLLPHLYQTKWFFGLCALGVGFIGFGLHRRRTRALLQREKQLVHMVDERTQELKKEINEHTRAEHELRLYKDHLEEQVAHRTKELRDSRELLQSVIDSSAALIYLRDLEGRFMLVNRRFAEVCGTTKDAMIGRTCHDFFRAEQADAFRLSDLRVLAATGAIESEETATHGGVEHMYYSIKCPLRDAQGRAYAVCGIATDITQLKQMQEQLRHSQKMEAIGRLAGGIAHDFNNLLTGINGYASLALLDLEAHNPLYESMREILKAGERAAGLTRQLLAYSRKQVLLPKRWNLNLIAAEMLTLLKRILGEDIAFSTALQSNLWDVLVDRGQIEQIMLNLVVNARDAMPAGGRLVLETANVTLDDAFVAQNPECAPGLHVMLAVSDTGTGLTPEVKARLFEPFFTTKEQGKGTGLGLSVVYGIVKQSGGSIVVESETGRGTVFRIYFPPARGDAPPEAGHSGDETNALRGHEAILLVEDEEFVRNFARTALETHGYTVTTARNGREALETLRAGETKFDLVVTDAIMPEMGGRALGETLRATMPRLPVLYMSGYTETSLLGDAPGGEEHFLQKPFSPSELARKVRGLLRQAAR